MIPDLRATLHDAEGKAPSSAREAWLADAEAWLASRARVDTEAKRLSARKTRKLFRVAGHRWLVVAWTPA